MPIDLNATQRGASDYEIRIYSPNRRRLFAILSGALVAESDDGIDPSVLVKSNWTDPISAYVRGGFYRLEYVMNESETGALALEMPALLPVSWFARDCCIEVWRTTDENRRRWTLEGRRLWLLTKARWVGGATPKILINAVDAIDVINRRIVAYAAASAQAKKSSKAIDLILKEVIEENLGASATDERNINFDTGAGWTFQGVPVVFSFSSGQLPTTSKSFSWRNLWDVCKELLEESAQLGTFASIQVNFISDVEVLEIALVIGHVGMDRSSTSGNPLILSEENGTLKDPWIEYDYASTSTIVYAGGAGEESNRLIMTAEDPSRSMGGPFTRTEMFIENTSIENRAELLSEANAALRAARPSLRFEGYISETDTVRYGVDYQLGMSVVAKAEQLQFDCRIGQVQNVVSATGDDVKARLFSDTLLQYGDA